MNKSRVLFCTSLPISPFSLSFLRSVEPSLNVVRATVVVTVEAVVAHVAGLADVEAFSIIVLDVPHVVIALALDALGAATTTDVRVLVVPDVVGVGAVVAVIFYQHVIIVIAEVGDVLSNEHGTTAGVIQRDGDGGSGASLLAHGGAGLLLGSDHDGLSVAGHRGRREEIVHVGVHVEGVDVVLGSSVQRVGDFLHDGFLFLHRRVALLLSAELDRLHVLLHKLVGGDEAGNLVLEHARLGHVTLLLSAELDRLHVQLQKLVGGVEAGDRGLELAHLFLQLVDVVAPVDDVFLKAVDRRIASTEHQRNRSFDLGVHNCVEVHFFFVVVKRC
tara:strand:+ start:2347 stop:3339 length:993 start_codon:yes stop_codon:yes gene_type:complete